MKICVITPTYNERENISRLIDALLGIFKSLKHEMHILVVDDNSPDGTGNIVRRYAKRHNNIHLLVGKKQGIGAAYIRGFKYAIGKFDVIIMMDADLSHNPQKIPELIKEIQNGYNLVIGSRYIPNGSTPDWGLSRKIISKCGNFFARIVGGLYKVHDCTTGFRAIKTNLLSQIDFRYLATRGYAFLTTLLYELYMCGAKIKEIPITFYDRKFGQTKLTKYDMVQFFLNSCRLRLRTGERFARFLIVGFCGAVLSTFLLWLLVENFGIFYLPAAAIAVEISIIFNFAFNDIYTFKDNIGKSDYLRRMLKFNAVALYGLTINLSVLYLLTTYTSLNYMFSNLVGILTATVWNYLAVMDYTWRVQTEVYYSKNVLPIESKISQ